MTVRQQLRADAMTRAGGVCEWPGCHDRGDELAHLHSIGMGGRRSADTLDNVAWLCWEHARVSDGEKPLGWTDKHWTWEHDRLWQAAGIEKALIPLSGGSVAWWRAEALSVVITDE